MRRIDSSCTFVLISIHQIPVDILNLVNRCNYLQTKCNIRNLTIVPCNANKAVLGKNPKPCEGAESRRAHARGQLWTEFQKLEPVVVRALSKPTVKLVPAEKPWRNEIRGRTIGAGEGSLNGWTTGYDCDQVKTQWNRIEEGTADPSRVEVTMPAVRSGTAGTRARSPHLRQSSRSNTSIPPRSSRTPRVHTSGALTIGAQDVRVGNIRCSGMAISRLFSSAKAIVIIERQ
jgi:hypothetical protein